MSLLVNKNIRVSESGERITYFSDEVFCLEKIPNNNIVGIIYPEHLSNLHISEICCLPRDMSCYTEEYINSWINYMENYFEDKMNTTNIMNNFTILKSIIDQYSYVTSRKFNIQNPTFADIINLINDDRLPIYEIKQKALRKVN